MKKLAIVVTHPIQYYVPVFRMLSNIDCVYLKVFYTWGKGSIKKYDQGFQREIEWDIPLLEGYEYEFLNNTSKDQGTHHFNGIKNPNIINRIKEFEPNAILIYGWCWNSHLKVLHYFKNKIPIIFRGDSHLIDAQRGYKKYLKPFLLRWIFSHIDQAIYVGSANREYYLKYGIHKERLRFVPHAIENKRFKQNYFEEAKYIRSQLHIPNEAIVILFAGKLEHKKDPFVLLEAFNALTVKNSYLLFVGNGVLEKELKEIALHSESSEHIKFMEFQNQQTMPAIYQACDLFCLPSKGPGETWGLSVNEAMASGKAVLVSNKVGCAIDLVRNERNGFIFQSGNVNDLKDKLIKMMNKTTLNNMGIESSKIIKDWSISRQARLIAEELQAI